MNADANLAADLMDGAATLSVPTADEVRALPGPDLDLHLVEHYRQLAVEQTCLHRAEGEAAARPHEARAAELLALTTVPLRRLASLQAKADASAAEAARLLDALSRYRTRPRGAVLRYYVFLVLLLGGDLAGMTGALISLGEVPWVAAVQALAVASAAVVVGMLASEIKHVRDARRRAGGAQCGGASGAQCGGASGAQRGGASGAQCGGACGAQEGAGGVPFGPDGGEPLVRWVLLGGLAVLFLVAGGVTALRSFTDGAGLIFGCFAAAVTLGSAANSYVHSDEVADLLGHAVRRARRDDAELRRLDLSPVGERDKEAALATTLRAEWRARGEAAAARVSAAGALALVNNPAVAGHGAARPVSGDVVRLRKSS